MEKQRKLPLGKKILFSALSLMLFLLFIELLLRLLVQPSDRCFGTLPGIDLPPVKVMYFPRDEGRQATEGGSGIAPPEPAEQDIRGIIRMDPTLGYAPRENAVSPHGWWRANNMGARSGKDLTKAKAPGRNRVLFFGESFTNCSRVRQHETWPHYLNGDHQGIEAVNFGVDGYSMGQCLLRYRSLKTRLDHDGVVLVFAPTCDLERDINICRDLIGWQTHTFLPRFRVEGGELALLRSSRTGIMFTPGSLNGEDLEFLRKHDAFYIPAKYESPPLVGGLVLYKFFARSCYADREYRLTAGLMEPGSEAMMVTRRIAGEMEKEAGRDKKKYMLFILPVGEDVKKYRDDRAFREKWDRAAASFREDGITCADLMKEFLEAPAERMDTGCDGTHYGPEANRFIAEAVAHHLKAKGLIPH